MKKAGGNMEVLLKCEKCGGVLLYRNEDGVDKGICESAKMRKKNREKNKNIKYSITLQIEITHKIRLKRQKQEVSGR